MTREQDTWSVSDASGEVDGDGARPLALAETSLVDDRRGLMARADPRGDLAGESVDMQLARRALFPAKAQKVTIGRFTVLRQIGQGGMGVVYACHDHQLDRKVAVKVLRADQGRGASLADTRLLREAQAMARLSHAHIVTVHEVGQTEGSVFVAMEFVDGVSLDAWMREPRPWPAIVAAFVQAGRGLAAAHRAGIVHRDFKPKTRSLRSPPHLPPSGRILANRGDLRRLSCRVTSLGIADLATEWQRACATPRRKGWVRDAKSS